MLIWSHHIAFRKHASLCGIHSYHSICEGYKTSASVDFILAIIYVCIFCNVSTRVSWNLFSWTKLILQPPIVNTIGVYGLGSQGARHQQPWNCLSFQEAFRFWHQMSLLFSPWPKWLPLRRRYFQCMKCFVFWSKLQWNLFRRIRLTIT